MLLETCEITRNEEVKGQYRVLDLSCGTIAPGVKPGQFVHVRIPDLDGALLRRPFSVFKAETESISILYKTVGRGTEALSRMEPGRNLSVMGPLGNGFPEPAPGKLPVMIAGGYGTAPLFLAASRSATTGMLFVGARSSDDILCVNEFSDIGWKISVATEDGSEGTRGIVTDLLIPWLDTSPQPEPELFACGPNGMLKAVTNIAVARNLTAWISMDRHMGCGVGACLACVQKIRKPCGPEPWKWARVCRDGPVFDCREIVWEDADCEQA